VQRRTRHWTGENLDSAQGLATAALAYAWLAAAGLALLHIGACVGQTEAWNVAFAGNASATASSVLSMGGNVVEQDLDRAVPGQYVVLFRPTTSPSRQAAALGSVVARGAVTKRMPGADAGPAVSSGRWGRSVFRRLMLVDWSVGRTELEGVMATLARHPDVMRVEPNWILRLHGVGPAPRVPNDFEFGRLWNLHNTGQNQGVAGADVKGPEAWGVTTGTHDVRVAVIDTGVDFFHPDLERNLWANPGETPGNGVDDDGNGYVDDVHGFDFVWEDSDPMDDMIHGTHVGGIIGAVGDNTVGVVGVAWQVSLMALKAFDETGDGQLWDVLTALQYALANGADIVNASWGQNERSQALADAVAELQEAGVVIVASAGNRQSERLGYPASLPGVIAVAAVNHRDERPFFSNYGSRVDLAAPGENVLSTAINNRYDNLSGTSMAAPHVSGVAALVWARHPQFDAFEVGNILRNSADPTLSQEYVGLGRINAGRAVRVDVPLPEAALDLPPVLSGRVDIAGTAAGTRFASYTLDLGHGAYPTNWVSLGGGVAPVRGGALLADVSTDLLDEGEYVVRLTVWDLAGQVATVRAPTTVRNVHLALPKDNDVVRAGERVGVRGTVFGAGRTYKLEYGVGWRPNTWRTNGVQLVSGGEQNVLDGPLAWWDTRAAETNQFYTLKLTAQADGQVVAESVVQLVFLDGSIRPGWPQYVCTEGEYPTNDWREVTVADLDNDGQQEILRVDASTPDGRPAALRVYGHDGGLRWVRELVAGEPCSDVPVVGDVDGDGFMEVFVDVGDQLFALRHDGSPVPGNWPVALEVRKLGKVLADLDGDGRVELVGYAQAPSGVGGGQNPQLVVYDGGGEVLRRWNFRDASAVAELPRLFPAVGDLDEDAELEIVALDGGHDLVVFDFNKTDGPVWRIQAYGRLASSPVLGDIDGDEQLEIVVGAYDTAAKGGTGTAGGIYVWDRYGLLLRGWPVLVDQSFPFSPAVADLNNDGRAEIVVASYSGAVLHVLQSDGFELHGWPVSAVRGFTLRTSPVVGDVNGDGRPDVVAVLSGQQAFAAMHGDLSKYGGLSAWTAEGLPIDLNPHPHLASLVLESVRTKSAPPVLADLDGNGFLDVVATTIDDYAMPQSIGKTHRKNRYTITAWSLPNVRASAASLPWPMFQHDPRLTGQAKPVGKVNRSPQIDRIPDQIVRSGTPFFPIELDRYVTDPDDQLDALVWTVLGATNLQVTIDSNRVAVVLAPGADWAGRELLRFVVRDPGGLLAKITAAFEIRTDYEPPVAVSDRLTVQEDETAEIDVLGNDTHPHGLHLSLLSFSRPGHGRLERTQHGTLRYLPALDYFGPDSFAYTVSDGEGGMAMTGVLIDVRPVQDPPVAVPDRVITEEDTPLELNVLVNDADPDGDALSLVWFGPPANGVLDSLASDGLRYTPIADFSGTDQFTYRIADGHGHESEAHVTIMVKPVNDPPVAKTLSYSINRNTEQTVMYQATDKDNDTLTFRVVEGPLNGELWSYPTIGTYYPQKGFVGLDTFTYAASDGTVESTPALVSVAVLDANNPPVALDQSIATRVGRALPIELSARDADDDAVTFTLLTWPGHGTLAGSSSNYVYAPEPGYVGQDVFTFRADDGKDTGGPATISIKVTDENTAPVAEDSSVTVFVDTPTALALQAKDPENDELNYTLLSLPAYGRLSGDPPNLVYAPKPGYVGPDRFTFMVSDGEFTSEPATVQLAVMLPNHAPVAHDQKLVLLANQKSQVPLDIEDADGDQLRIAILKGPRHGLVSGTGTNYFLVPKPGFVGADRFTYRVWDGTVYSDVATVTLSIQSQLPPAPPQFESVQVLEGGVVRLTLRVSPGYNLQLLSSTNLADWVSLTNLVAREYVVTVTDLGDPPSPARFYRAKNH